MVKTNILQITNDNWCYGFLHCNLTHFILDPLMSADLHHVYPATFQPHRSAVPATGGQAPGDDWTIPFQGRKRKGIRIDTWQPQARKNKQQAKSSSDEASQCYSTKVILLQVSIPSILGIKKLHQRTSESSMGWYCHSPRSIDSCWLSCVTRWSWDLFVLLSCHRPYPWFERFQSTRRCCNSLWVCHEALMMVSSCTNDSPLSWAPHKTHIWCFFVVIRCNVHPIPSHHSLCVSSISITPGRYRARRGNQGKSCPSGGYLLSRLEMLEDPFGQCFTVLPVLLLLLYYFWWGERGRGRFIASYCLFKCGKVKKGGRIIVKEVPSWRIQWLDTLLAWRKQAQHVDNSYVPGSVAAKRLFTFPLGSCTGCAITLVANTRVATRWFNDVCVKKVLKKQVCQPLLFRLGHPISRSGSWLWSSNWSL